MIFLPSFISNPLHPFPFLFNFIRKGSISLKEQGKVILRTTATVFHPSSSCLPAFAFLINPNEASSIRWSVFHSSAKRNCNETLLWPLKVEQSDINIEFHVPWRKDWLQFVKGVITLNKSWREQEMLFNPTRPTDRSIAMVAAFCG